MPVRQLPKVPPQPIPSPSPLPTPALHHNHHHNFSLVPLGLLVFPTLRVLLVPLAPLAYVPQTLLVSPAPLVPLAPLVL